MANRSKWEEMTSAVKEVFTPKVKPYEETREKRPTIDQVDAKKRKQQIDEAVGE